MRKRRRENREQKSGNEKISFHAKEKNKPSCIKILRKNLQSNSGANIKLDEGTQKQEAEFIFI